MELGTVATTKRASTEGEQQGMGSSHDVCGRPIDLVHLARYTLGNKALEREILDLFVGQSRVTLDKLTAAADERAWREQAHTLLGSARAVGAKRVADRVLVAQKLAWATGGPQRPGVLAAIATEIEAANRYIRDLFPED